MERGIGTAIAERWVAYVGSGLRADQARAQTHEGQYAEADIRDGWKVDTSDGRSAHGARATKSAASCSAAASFGTRSSTAI